MTTEKAIEFGKIFLKSIENEKGSAIYEFVETAVKMMEQEPCEDCIGREAVLEAFTHWYSDLLENNKEEVDFADVLINIPSVRPKEKVGHWRLKSPSPYEPYTCSICESVGVSYYNYCPNCGCRMERSE